MRRTWSSEVEKTFNYQLSFDYGVKSVFGIWVQSGLHCGSGLMFEESLVIVLFSVQGGGGGGRSLLPSEVMKSGGSGAVSLYLSQAGGEMLLTAHGETGKEPEGRPGWVHIWFCCCFFFLFWKIPQILKKIEFHSTKGLKSVQSLIYQMMQVKTLREILLDEIQGESGVFFAPHNMKNTALN